MTETTRPTKEGSDLRTGSSGSDLCLGSTTRGRSQSSVQVETAVDGREGSLGLGTV